MTTIAYRDGIMAGDTQVEWAAEASGICSGYENKVFKHRRCLIATSGNAGQGWDYIAWFAAGEKGEPQYEDDDDPLDFHALVIRPDGSVWKCENGGRLIEQLDDYGAIGSGYSAAMAAMENGATAILAVSIAAKYDPATGGRILTVSLEEKL